MRWRWSVNVCPPASPAASQNSAGIGRVATISEYTGTTERGASCADHATAALDGPRETPHEPRGLDACAVRRVRRAQHAGGADERRRLRGRDEARLGTGPAQLHRGAGEGHRAALRPVAGDALRGHRLAD